MWNALFDDVNRNAALNSDRQSFISLNNRKTLKVFHSKLILLLVQILLESFKAVLEQEREAEKIVMEAEKKAEKIRNEAKKKAEKVYMETYQETLAIAKRKSIKMKEQAKKDAEFEAQIFIKRAENLKKTLHTSAKQKFAEAVDSVLQEILS